ncbi:hypothetical protein HA72_0988 [Metallosphaera sedula]|uniref:TRASH domain-containing protein n=3 Tax=Metallosphaera TaxID=41980 RepID=A4YFF4_METS5|nr:MULTISPECIES: TA0938 family protein [Metallosphaera]ABP95156.1 hypothetical protein Msed_0988 [Metallosphaera sedula DSM 5348]AIM27142.1 hypothetical protein HA72_0988 [Metallosphaera sedula]AKV74046.1 hypothetical protein MsedA_1001 [Metallosphaera sedula]AKV76286.1 hypothetical protein MsedB_1003 [Metallosphaera sedula]AKV78537.1 hypothetical protein MsedC_1001 [Metallosphaera sedula]
MKIVVNGEEAGTKEKGCALCGATWGGWYEDVDGERLFFCCDVCAREFLNMLNRVKEITGWGKVDELIINGDYYRGRNCEAKSEGKSLSFYVKFGEDAEITTFIIKGNH